MGSTTNQEHIFRDSHAGRNPKRLSILLACQTYPPCIGGSEVEAQRVSAGLIRRGHRVEVICTGGPPMPDSTCWTDPYGVPVRMYGHRPGKWSDRVYAAALAWTLLRAPREFDLVYFLMQGLHVATTVPLARLLRIPSVMKFAGSNDLTDVLNSGPIGRFEISVLRKWSEKTLVLNEAMTSEAIGAGFDPAKVMWAANPVDTREYRPANDEERASIRRELGIPMGVPAIIFVGRLVPVKELPTLISAFSLAAAQHPNAVLIVVGDGPVRQQVTEQAASLGVLQRVIFAGMQSPEQICRWLQASDIFTLVSHREGLPVALIEAMAVGLPSVVTDLPAIVQLIEDGRHGFHAKVRMPETVTSGMLRLLNDPELRQRFGSAAREVVVKRFSLETVIDSYENLFLEVVSNASRSRG